jgi:hypothetical protein
LRRRHVDRTGVEKLAASGRIETGTLGAPDNSYRFRLHYIHVVDGMLVLMCGRHPPVPTSSICAVLAVGPRRERARNLWKKRLAAVALPTLSRQLLIQGASVQPPLVLFYTQLEAATFRRRLRVLGAIGWRKTLC